MRRLAEEIGVTVRHLRRLLRSLEEKGFIRSDARFRADGSQSSNVIRWVFGEAADLTPPGHGRPAGQTPEPALETFKETPVKKQHAASAECDLDSPMGTAASLTAPASPKPETSIGGRPESPQSHAKTPNDKPTTPEPNRRPASPQRPSKAFIVINGQTFLQTQEIKRVYDLALEGKLLNSGVADKLLFVACWCTIAAKYKAGLVRRPEALMRWLLSNRKAMAGYPDQAGEQKARGVIRHLWPERPYNPR